MGVPNPPTKVVVRNLLKADRSIAVLWESLNGLSGINVYRNYVPYGTFTKINPSLLAPGLTGFIDSNAAIIDDTDPYYCVSLVNASGEGPLSPPVTYEPLDNFQRDPFVGYPESPQLQVVAPAGNLPTNLQMQYYFHEIRRRDLWLLEQDGGYCWLFKRNWPSQTPQTAEELDRYDQFAREGQYFPPIKIKVRFVSAEQNKVLAEYGLRREKIPRSWTIWTPLIHDHDVIIDSRGRRFEVTSVTPHYFRDLITHQDFDLRLLESTDEAYKNVKFEPPEPLRPLPPDSTLTGPLP